MESLLSRTGYNVLASSSKSASRPGTTHHVGIPTSPHEAGSPSSSSTPTHQRQGGWSSINNHSGHPYTPLGAPILDFVYPAMRRRLQMQGKGGSTSTQGGGEREKKQREEKESSNAEYKKENDGAHSSNSLDILDPVRDLLALCTPRRADILSSSSAIIDRVRASEDRIRRVRAGATFQEIDNCLKDRDRIRKWQKEAEEILAAQEAENSPSNQQQQLSSSPTSAFPLVVPPSPSLPSFPHSNLSSDASIGSALLQSSLKHLAKLLNSSTLNIHSPPATLQEFRAREIGATFPLNYEGNHFLNMPPHPLLAWEERKKREKERKRKSTSADKSRVNTAGSPSSVIPPSSPLLSPPPPLDITASSRSLGAPSPRSTESSSSPPPSELGRRGEVEDAIAKEQRRPSFNVPPLNVGEGSPSSTSRTQLGLPLSSSPSASSTSRPPDRSHSLSPSSSSPSVSPQRSGRKGRRRQQTAPNTARYSLSHAPPSNLSFHELRYTLHQSFGVEEKEKERQKEKEERRKRRQKLGENTGGEEKSAEGAGPSGATDSPTTSPPHSPTSATSPLSSSRRTARSRRAKFLASMAGGDGVSANPDAEYAQAVHESKYRREHNNSPTSHWGRLQENVSQRYTQLQALWNMAYFRDASVFAQGGAFADGAQEEEEKEAEGLGGSQTERHMGGDNQGGLTSGSPAHIMHSARIGKSMPPLSSRSTLSSSSSSNPNSSVTPRSILSTSGDTGLSLSARSRLTQLSTPTSQRIGAQAARRNIHKGQILRQVANTAWPGGATGGGGSADIPADGDFPSKAELTLARCYADFDLAKKDLRERLYEALALMDTERGQMLVRKYEKFSPQYLEAEQDILNMRVSAERERYQIVQERLDNYSALAALICFVNQQNGGNNGQPLDASSLSLSSSSASPSTSPLAQIGAGAILGQPGPTGMVGFTNQAGLPTFEEIYVIEVLCCLCDSSLPLLSHHPLNRVGAYARPQDWRPEAPVRVGEEPAITHAHQHTGGIHPALLAMAGGKSISVGGASSQPGGSINVPSSGSSRGPSRRVTVAPGVGATGSIVASGLTNAGSILRNVGVPGASTSQPISPHTPPPCLLLFLLCLSPTVLKFKEVRELIDRWARLTGVSEEAVENALRMIGVDPRVATYSGRVASKAASAAAAAAAAAGGVEGAGASSLLSPSAQMLLLDGAGLLDPATKREILAGGGGSSGPIVPASRPLSSVILAPVSLGEWESKKSQERAKQNARNLSRKLKTLRSLTTSSNAATRLALGLGAKGTQQHLSKLTPEMERVQQKQKQVLETALKQRERREEEKEAEKEREKQEESAEGSIASSSSQPASSSAVSSLPSTLLLNAPLAALPEETTASATSPTGAASPSASKPPALSSPRVPPPKHSTGVSQSLHSLKEKRMKIQIVE